MERLLEREQFAVELSAGERTEVETFGAEPLGDAQRGERGQMVESSDAPAVERLEQAYLAVKRDAAAGVDGRGVVGAVGRGEWTGDSLRANGGGNTISLPRI